MKQKFRAWDKKENKWVDYPIYIDANGDVYWENYERGLQEADDLIVMQYTGLKDKMALKFLRVIGLESKLKKKTMANFQLVMLSELMMNLECSLRFLNNLRRLAKDNIT